MRGMLTFFILWLLSKRSMHGQEIADEIGKRRGNTPTPGTIYPALKELRLKGLVDMERTGRTTEYSLTKSGHAGLLEAGRYFNRAFGEIFHEYQDTT
jgi:DNA-binding PadR family transcriptional regulator